MLSINFFHLIDWAKRIATQLLQPGKNILDAVLASFLRLGQCLVLAAFALNVHAPAFALERVSSSLSV